MSYSQYAVAALRLRSVAHGLRAANPLKAKFERLVDHLLNAVVVWTRTFCRDGLRPAWLHEKGQHEEYASFLAEELPTIADKAWTESDLALLQTVEEDAVRSRYVSDRVWKAFALDVRRMPRALQEELHQVAWHPAGRLFAHYMAHGDGSDSDD